MMRKVYWSLGLSLMMLCGSPSMAEDAPGADERGKKLENLLEIAVDRFQLNRFVEARAALNRLIAENPTDEEAFKLRKLFGEKILLEMQRFGNRPTLNEAERKALQMLGEASYAMDRGNPAKAADRLENVVKIFQDAKYAEDSFSLKYAQELAEAIKALTPESTAEIHEYANKLHLWREQLQSVGNVPLVLLSRAQRYEQDKLRSPETVRRIVNGALAGKDNAQRNLLEIIRLGVFAVPDLLDGLRNDKNDTRHTNAHFVLLTLGNRIVLPLCEALKSNDQLFLQQLCAVLGEIRPADPRAVPYLKAVYDNPKNLASTIDAAGYALRNITGKEPKDLLPAADYFLLEGNRYYFGGDDVDREMEDAKGTFWAWDQEVNDGKGALRELQVPSFAIADLMAEEMAYRGMATATDKTPFQVLLASVFLQQKNKIDTLNKLLAREDLSHPDTAKLRKDARDWGKRMERNQRIAYTLGLDHMAAVLEKAMRDGKTEVAVNALEAISVIAGENGWHKLAGYGAPVAPAAKTFAPAAKDGNGASGDEGEADDQAETETVKTVEPAAEAAPASALAAQAPVAAPAAANPVLAALDSKNSRIAVAAANALVNIGLPVSHPAYKKLLPLLLDGAQENRATVVEIISGNGDLRRRFADDVEKGQMMPQVASDGYAGYSLAIQYPPKDVILIDNRLDQFNALRLQMSLRGISQNRVLPLTIITTRDHVSNIAMQFTKEEIEKEAASRHLDADSILTKENNRFDSGNWRVVVQHDIKSDTKNFFDTLRNLMKIDQKQAVVIVTQPNREERFKLKNALQLAAERSLRPESLSEYANLRNKDKVLGDVFGVRVTYSPVFVDEEIAGYDTMRTVQALQTDPRTRAVPLGILTETGEDKNVRADFDRFIKDGVVEIISRNIGFSDLVEKMREMKKKNTLSEKNYARALSNDIATRSATALSKLSVAGMGRALTADEEKQLLEVVRDPNRPVDLRIAAAHALGHFQAKTAMQGLKTLFTETDQKEVALRAAIIRAIGEIDTTNAELDFKLAAMNESAEEVQKEAARALGPAAQNQDQLKKYMETLRPNDPLTMAREAKDAKASAAGGEAAEDGENKEAEADAAEEKPAAEEKKDDAKDDDISW